MLIQNIVGMYVITMTKIYLNVLLSDKKKMTPASSYYIKDLFWFFIAGSDDLALSSKIPYSELKKLEYIYI